MVTLCWFAWIGVRGGAGELTTQPLDIRTQSWIEFSPRVAMLAALSLPLFGGWALLWTRALRTEALPAGADHGVHDHPWGMRVYQQHLLNRALMAMVEVESATFCK